MGFAEERGDYWRGRYKIEPGKYGTVKDEYGKTIRFRTKRAAEKAAAVEEEKALAASRVAPAGVAERITFGDYASRWYDAQDLAASTMQNYRRHIEEHLLPQFEEAVVSEITKGEIDAWERSERDRGYAASSIKTWRGTLHLILADAVDEELRDSNPATRRRGRGKRAGRSRNRGPEKVVTSALGVLLIAERAALLSGRDDEFVGVVLKGYTGMRWGEIVGLEAKFVRPSAVRVEHQLYELDSGEMHRCPPKDDSYRTIDVPHWLARLLRGQVSRAGEKPCDCHELRYLFSGHSAANGAARRPGAKLVDVARVAGVSTGTVSNVLNRPTAVADSTRAAVEQAIADLGYIRYWPSVENAAHWRRNGFATWLFQPAATGWYPKKAPQEAHPVPLVAEPWPGIPARGRGAARRAEASWVPIARGLTPHGLRHSHKTMMDELRTPPKLKDERMGHEDGSVQARYSHITPEMRRELLAGLTGMWEESLDARRRMAPGSPVAVLDALLRGRP
ncbi:LacI family DNA-binding transcriptional regulator [Streptomyces sp. NPDC003038]|uniref:tyrosine-type recombinase/integrase n=1 Tax=unclassified Streptomyces TaxID=2593676 RepID=UPI0033A8A161